eukprot:832743-Pleurochrysis_carterae.AAC.1
MDRSPHGVQQHAGCGARRRLMSRICALSSTNKQNSNLVRKKTRQQTIFGLALQRYLSSTLHEELTGLSSDCVGLGRLWGV